MAEDIFEIKAGLALMHKRELEKYEIHRMSWNRVGGDLRFAYIGNFESEYSAVAPVYQVNLYSIVFKSTFKGKSHHFAFLKQKCHWASSVLL